MKKLLLSLSLGVTSLCACTPSVMGPVLTGVSPDRGPSNRVVAVTITGERLQPLLFTDFGQSANSQLDGHWSARLGREPLDAVTMGDDGAVHAEVPAGFAPGTYDVVVVDPAGVTLTLPAAYRVVSADSVSVLIASYRIDPIGAQRVDAPFPITVSAVDAAGVVVDGYSGSVTLTDLTNTVVPGALALFAHGQWTGPVQISQTAAADVLTVSDALGHAGASNAFAVTPGAPAALRFSTPPRLVLAGSCSDAVTVQLVDAAGTPTPQTAALPLAVTGLPSLGLGLFADSSCTTALSSPTVAAGQAELTFHLRSTTAGSLEVRAQTAGLPGAMQRETVLPGAPAALAFVSAPQTLTAGACSAPLALEVHDSFGNAAPVAADTTVALAATPSVGFAFFSDLSCGAATPQALIAAGQSSAQLSMLGTTAGVINITGSAAGLTAATQMVRINPEGFATQVAFVSAAQTVMVGSCSSTVALQTQDSLGNPVTNLGAVTISLLATPASALAFFSDSSCTTPRSTVTLSAGQSTGTIYFRASQPGAVTVQADSTGLLGAQQTETVLAGPPAQLAFVSAPRVATAAVCSADVIVQVQDAAGFASPVSASTAITLAGAPTTGFALFADATCTTPLGSLTLAPGADSGRVYFRGTVAGTVTLTATSPGLTSAQQPEQVRAGAPSQLVFTTAPQTVGAGACSGITSITLQDTFGNTAIAASATPLGLAAVPSVGLTFYSDPGCATAASTVTVPAGASQQSFFFRSTAVGPVALAVASAGLGSAQQTQSVVAGAPATLVFTTAPQTVPAGGCSQASTVEARDALGNSSPVVAPATVALSAAPGAGFTFYSDAACGAVVTQLLVPAGSSAATFYFKGTAALLVSATASATGLTTAAQSETIVSGADAALVFSSPPRTVNAGSCSLALTVEVRDAFGNPSAQLAPRAVSLTAAPPAGFGFFSDAVCSVPVSGVSVGTGASTASFYVTGSSAGPVTVTAQSTAVSAAVQTATVTGSTAPTALVFTTAPRTVASGACSVVLTVQSQDSGGTPRPVPSDTTVSLVAAPAAGLSFFSDAACTVAASSVLLATGSTAVSFFARGGLAGTVGVTASAAGLNPAVQNQTVTPGMPDRLVFTSTPQTLLAGACSGVATVQSRDAAGNPAPPAASATVALSSGTGITFYSDPGCTTAVASVALGAGTSAVGFSFRGTVAGARTLTGQVTAWLPAAQPATITAGAPAALAFTTAPLTATAGSCSSAATVEVRDAFGNAATLATPMPVGLSQAGVAVGLFSGACAAVVTQVTVAAGQSTVSFTLQGTVAGQVTVTGTAAGLPPVAQVEAIGPAAPTVLTFVSTAQTLVAGACSAAATVEARDAFGNPSAVAAATTLTLSGVPATGYSTSAAAGCGATTAAVVMASGATQASFYFRDTRAGTVSAQVAAAGFTGAAQTQTITAGSATAFLWDPVPATVTIGVPFSATVRAVDAFGNAATSFTGTAALTLTPGTTTVACAAACTNSTTTDVFTSGVWTGSLTVAGAAGTGRVLTATQGALTGNSAAFTVAAVNRTPPIARFTFTPLVVSVGQAVTFNASTSSDLQTATAALQVSWDFTGVAAGAAPWSAWTTTKTASNTFSTVGDYQVRLAVKDSDGDLGYATHTVHVLPAASPDLCVVDIVGTTDDGATSCSSLGPDGKLSLAEAVRVSNTLPGKQTITFASGLSLTGTTTITFTDSADLVGRAGVNLIGWVPRVATAGAVLRIYDLTFTEPETSISCTAGATMELHHVVLVSPHQPLFNRATMLVENTAITGCQGNCMDVNGGTTVRFSEIRTAATHVGITVPVCAASGPHLDVSSTVFAGLATGISSSCAATLLVRNNTFDANGTGVTYASGAGNVLVNNLFTNHTVAATACGTATFAQRDYQGLFANVANGCVSGDVHVLAADPGYSVAGSADYRLIFSSPAVDFGLDLGLKLTQAGPGNFLGANPDLGAMETY